ncbi:MAG TPA: DsbE family thiol:disulfide interchange protein [Gammaproteobacteria bacterium]|nr:DsbE family thiol:disulfide interchange protein [Gammaproteobacteria bacterium]MCH79031.1 DsbE family thiol:disulfide interchange protein [Gammaproteobacteria bacterium]
MKLWRLLLIPALALLLGALALGLLHDPKRIPSPLIGKPLPTMTGETLDGRPVDLATAGQGGPMLINVWASWCESCAVEHPVVVEASRRFGDRVAFIGLNYRDERAPGQAWLDQRGNAYRWSFYDPEGRAGLELGIYGVPETFFVAPDGTLLAKHVGPLDAATLRDYLSRLFGVS